MICRCCSGEFKPRFAGDHVCGPCELLEGFGPGKAVAEIVPECMPAGTGPNFLSAGNSTGTDANAKECCPPIPDFLAPSASETVVTSKSDSPSAHDPSFALAEGASRCEIREGIGLCDDCCLPKWPQNSVGYGFMFCLDCIAKQKRELDNHVELFRAATAVHKRMDQRTRERGRGGRHFMSEVRKAANPLDGYPPITVVAPAHPHELTTPAHTWEHLLKLWEASYQLGLDALLERRGEQSRFYLVCSDADWASVQMRAMRC